MAGNTDEDVHVAGSEHEPIVTEGVETAEEEEEEEEEEDEEVDTGDMPVGVLTASKVDVIIISDEDVEAVVEIVDDEVLGIIVDISVVMVVVVMAVVVAMVEFVAYFILEGG